MAIQDDGYQTTINLTGAGTTFKEKTLKPPGLDGGDAIDTTTMRNTTWRTKAPRALKTMTAMTFTAAYDPAFYSSVVSIINVNQEIILTFPDDATLTFWGWLRQFEPGDTSEGAQPEATCTIEVGNQNGSGVETAPVYAAAAT